MLVRLPDGSEHPGHPDAPGASRRRRPLGIRALQVQRPDSLAAVVTWLICTPLAVMLAGAFDLDPFTVAGAVMPIAVGCFVGIALLAYRLYRPSTVIIGVGAGAYAGWMALTMAAALRGTPYGYGTLVGDEGRLLAMAAKNMTQWGSVDAYVRHLPTEYPPMYPWVLGHVAHLLGRPAWRIEGYAQILVMSGAFVLGYVLWRRLVGAPWAFLIQVMAPAGLAEPSKAYEFLTILVVIPWILGAFAVPLRDRRHMHWLPAGVIGGLIVLTYSAYLVFSMLGLLAIAVLAWREGQRRRPYVLHVVAVIVVAAVVASWYIVPFISTYLTHGGQRLSDTFLDGDLVSQPLPMSYTDPTPLGLLELVGLVGLVWYRRTAWWGRPMLLIALSAFAYRVLFLFATVHNNHTGYLQYTNRYLQTVLWTAGVLTLATALPAIRARLPGPIQRQREVALLGVAVVVAWSSWQGWQQWMPGPRGVDAYRSAGVPNQATVAHSQPLPNGELPRYAPPNLKPFVFPVDRVRGVIASSLGSHARPVVLSYDQRLYVFEPYYGYLVPDRLAANSLQRWDTRADQLRQLAQTYDPQAFAEAASHTTFGPIDVFVLRDRGTVWNWDDIAFAPKSFSGGQFKVVHVTPSTVVAVRLSSGS